MDYGTEIGLGRGLQDASQTLMQLLMHRDELRRQQAAKDEAAQRADREWQNQIEQLKAQGYEEVGPGLGDLGNAGVSFSASAPFQSAATPQDALSALGADAAQRAQSKDRFFSVASPVTGQRRYMRMPYAMTKEGEAAAAEARTTATRARQLADFQKLLENDPSFTPEQRKSLLSIAQAGQYEPAVASHMVDLLKVKPREYKTDILVDGKPALVYRDPNTGDFYQTPQGGTAIDPKRVSPHVPLDPAVRIQQLAEARYLTDRARATTAWQNNPAVNASFKEAKALTSLIQFVNTPGKVFDKELQMSLARVLLPGQAADKTTLQSLANAGSWSDRAQRFFMNATTGQTIPPDIRAEIGRLIEDRVQAGEELLSPFQAAGAGALRSGAALLDVPPNIAADSASAFKNPYEGLKPSIERMRTELDVRKRLRARGLTDKQINDTIYAMRERQRQQGGSATDQINALLRNLPSRNP